MSPTAARQKLKTQAWVDATSDRRSARGVDQHDLVIDDADRRQLETLAGARTLKAEAVRNAEQRAMRGAEQMLPGAGEEAVGQKIERRAHMGASILIGVQRAAPVHHEDQLQIRARAEAETAAAAFGYCLGAAEPPPGHPGTPA